MHEGIAAGKFKGLGQQPAFLVVEDVASDCLAEDGRISEGVEIVVRHLKGQAERIGILIDQLLTHRISSGNQGSHLCSACNQDSRLKAYHHYVVVHRD